MKIVEHTEIIEGDGMKTLHKLLLHIPLIHFIKYLDNSNTKYSYQDLNDIIKVGEKITIEYNKIID